MEYFVYDNGPDWMHYKLWVRVPGCSSLYAIDGGRQVQSVSRRAYSLKTSTIRAHRVRRIESLAEVNWYEESLVAANRLISRLSMLLSRDANTFREQIYTLEQELTKVKQRLKQAKEQARISKIEKNMLYNGRA